MLGWSRSQWVIATQTLGVMGLSATALLAQASIDFRLDATRDQVKEWLETERTLAQEAHEWELEKASLRDRIQLFENELADLEEAVAMARENATEADSRRAELRAQESELREHTQRLIAVVIDAEDTLRATLPYLPEPLLEEVRPLIQRIPKDPAQTSLTLAQRVQNVVGILTQSDRFNNGVTVVSAIQDLPSGGKAEVQTIYFGLGVAYFADPAGQFAGYGYPSAAGWRWEQEASLAPAVLATLAMYDNRQPAALTPMPVTVR